MEELKSINSDVDAVKLANEIHRLDAALKLMKNELKAYVKDHGALDTGEEIWDIVPSVSWSFDAVGLKEAARNIAFEGVDPWSMMSISKSNLNKLGWDEDFLKQIGKKKVTNRFTSRKNK